MKLLLIGSITHSLAKYPDGVKERFGGGVMYGGRTAAKLGIDTTVVTVGADDIEGGVEELRSLGVDVVRVNRKSSNNFSNDYTKEPREMLLRSVVEASIEASDVKLNVEDYDCIVLIPIYREIGDSLLSLFAKKTVLLDLQGFARSLEQKNTEGLYPKTQSDWVNIDQCIGKIEILKLSREDIEGIKSVADIKTDEDKMKFFVERGFPIVILTRDVESVIVATKGGIAKVPAFKVDSQDTAGAGEVFAIAFMYKYFETRDAVESTKFANACAALKISGQNYDLESTEKFIAERG